MKGIILAGGYGTRLYPITLGLSKQLLPVYDKPMIYYPLSVLMLADIRDILIITNPEYLFFYKKLLGNGKDIGINLKYAEQKHPKGLAEAFLIGEKFIGKDSVSLILGDNIFYGTGFTTILKEASKITKGALIFGYYVNNPEQFGVVEFDRNFNVISLEEKPDKPKSNYAIPGLYFYDNTVIKKAKSLKPSKRGELEITDINKKYLEEETLKVKILGRGFAWLDTGTYDGLANATDFVKTIQKRTGLYIACLEEIAYKKGWINKEKLKFFGEKFKNTDYGKYLLSIINE
ncbi:glucose-1-phosphate thymidylyltransferase RfbA [Marinitoga sp. 1138]|uniref:glucose-1-phosphate thymidylyltransferase RfbA n=1 Tax=Marinitoga sp. 1138 TaxID=1643334 RepID=UPI0015868D74|nr:glucose-1-phosphate thymidylyltransferase RfbA [Marinitoga sp. 1138]NUU97596.1 glucose-1-phosphate thymidylyltransferase [Marinitoga sp. 1138]